MRLEKADIDIIKEKLNIKSLDNLEILEAYRLKLAKDEN